MITIKSSSEIALMRAANIIARDALRLIEEHIKPGVTTKQLDRIAHNYIIKSMATPSFLGYSGFPASICASVNEEVVHGIPSDRRLEEGDIISCDVGTIYMGWQGDTARTYAVGKISSEKARLMTVTEESFFAGVKILKDGVRIGNMSSAIQNHVEKNGFGVVRSLVGHGIGREMHEDPPVPNYGKVGHGIVLKAGMTLAIEPMVNMGTFEVDTLQDGWTIITKDGLPSAHYENTVLITKDGYEILSI